MDVHVFFHLFACCFQVESSKTVVFISLFSYSLFLSFFSFLFVIEHMMPLCMVISWVYSVAMMIQHIVAEKEHRLKEVRLCDSAFVVCRAFDHSMCCFIVTIFNFLFFYNKSGIGMSLCKRRFFFYTLMLQPTNMNINVNIFCHK